MLTKTTKLQLQKFVDTEFAIRDVLELIELVENAFQEELARIKLKVEREKDKREIQKLMAKTHKLNNDYYEVLDMIERRIDSVGKTLRQ